MKAFFKEGEYDQVITYLDNDYLGKVQDVTCTCTWSTFHSYAYQEGITICKHIKSILIKLTEKKNE